MTDVSERAKRHLWMHFTRLGSFADHEVPVIVRGAGVHVWDQHGKRYLDGLSGLFTVQVGHGRRELAEAAAQQASTLAYFPVWSFATEPAVELASRLAALAPGDLNRVFFTTSGSEAVESAWKLAIAYHRATRQPQRRKVVTRKDAYHGTTLGALSLTGVASIRTPYEPLVPGAVKVASTDRYRCASCAGAPACTLACADDIEARILMEGPETVAAVVLEPVQNVGGALAPPAGYWQRVREICDRYGVLLVADEVICAFGRLGEWFGSIRHAIQPDLLTFAKGVTSGYAPLGGVLVSDRIAEPFLEDPAIFLHGMTFGAHPVACAVALANLDLFEREAVLAHARAMEPVLSDALAPLRDLPLVGEVRGQGHLRAIELVSDRDTKAGFPPAQQEWLLRGFLSPRLYEAGLICRADDRADPIITLAPPLVCDEGHLAFIGDTLRTVLRDAGDELRREVR